MFSLDSFINFLYTQLVHFFQILQDTKISFGGLSISVFDAILSYFILFFILSIFFGFNGGGDE